MKRKICINGKIIFPLKEGSKAVISCKNEIIYTSLVVKIIEEKTDYVCFETMNSVYQVCLFPVSVVAAVPSFLKMCA